jgi:hypothetical protein
MYFFNKKEIYVAPLLFGSATVFPVLIIIYRKVLCIFFKVTIVLDLRKTIIG